MSNSACYYIVDLVRETRTDDTLARPLVLVRDSELALASLLGLGSAAGVAGAHQMRAGVVYGLVLGLALVLALVGLGAAL